MSTLYSENLTSNAKLEVSQSELDRTLKTVQTQTALIVDLRKASIPRNFESLNKLRSWVNNWEVKNRPIAVAILNRTFIISGNDELYSAYWDCDDISEAMQRDALKDGYLMSVFPVGIESATFNHLGCLAEADNGYWFIEPQTGEMTLIARRD